MYLAQQALENPQTFPYIIRSVRCDGGEAPGKFHRNPVRILERMAAPVLAE